MGRRTFTLRVFAFAFSLASIIIVLIFVSCAMLNGGWWGAQLPLNEGPVELPLLAVGIIVVVYVFAKDVIAYRDNR